MMIESISVGSFAMLLGVGFLAGFIDAIAGGGGLLTLPALLLSGLPTSMALGTNKIQGVFGTSVTVTKYWRSKLMDRKRAWRAIPPALIGGGAGVMLVTKISNANLTPLVLTLLFCVAVFMLFYRPPKKPESRHRSFWVIAAVSFALGFYDGFFGPGMGTIAIVLAILVWGDSANAASANAKAMNFSSNLIAAILFFSQGLVSFAHAIPMGIGQIAGGYLGAHTTIRSGPEFVRRTVVIVSIALILRLAYRMLSGG